MTIVSSSAHPVFPRVNFDSAQAPTDVIVDDYGNEVVIRLVRRSIVDDFGLETSPNFMAVVQAQ